MPGKRSWIDEAADEILAKGRAAAQVAERTARDTIKKMYEAQLYEAQVWRDVAEQSPASGTRRGPYRHGAPQAPAGYSVNEHMDQVRERRGDLTAMPWWISKVAPERDWDPKKIDRKYEDLGNYDYGATGTALGIPPDILLRGAGAVQMVGDILNPKKDWNPEWGWPLGARPYGDEPRDQQVIMNGVDRVRREASHSNGSNLPAAAKPASVRYSFDPRLR